MNTAAQRPAPDSFTVLFVDDEQPILEGLGRSLYPTPAGWRLEFCADPRKALALVRERSFDAAVVDMAMPGMNGVELLSQIEAASPDTVRLMLTASGDYPTALAAVNEGRVFRFLAKPCGREELLHALELASRQYRLLTAERTLLRAKLEHAERVATIGRFTAGIVHDINNHLFTILGLASAEVASSPADLHLITEAASRAHELTQELMAFSRQDQAEPLQPLTLAPILESCARLAAPALQHRVRLELQIPANLPAFVGHAGRLKQVVTNIVLNARDAITGQGQIILSAGVRTFAENDAAALPPARSGRFVWFAVTDNGCGMDDATRAHLFEAFFTTKPQGKGTGLGLALARQIVDQHHGWIAVESAPRIGSTFRVFLPVAATSAPERSAPPLRPSVPDEAT
ncbi:MAG TPA: ATP-binding protein [Opitutaceae bacterium]|nr:ATP-binding protein [Opitutaceae bacterium]